MSDLEKERRFLALVQSARSEIVSMFKPIRREFGLISINFRIDGNIFIILIIVVTLQMRLLTCNLNANFVMHSYLEYNHSVVSVRGIRCHCLCNKRSLNGNALRNEKYSLREQFFGTVRSNASQ